MLARARSRFNKYPRQFWLMFVGVVISQAGASMILPYILIYVSQKLNASLGTAAVVASVESVAAVLTAVLAGTLADRIGRKTVMVISLFAGGLAYVGLLHAATYSEFALALALLGFSTPLYQVGSDAMVADMIPKEEQAEAYAISRIGLNVGFAIGPALGGFLVATSYGLAFVGASAGFLINAVLLSFFARESLGRDHHFQRGLVRDTEAPAKKGARRGYTHVLRDRAYMAYALLVGVAYIPTMTIWILLAAYAKNNFGMPESEFGWIATTNAVMCITLQYTVTKATLRYTPVLVVTAGALLSALGAGSVALMTGFWGFWTSIVVITLAELLMVPTSAALIASIAPADLRGRYMSMGSLSWSLAGVVAPIMGGFLNDRIGPASIWYGSMLVGLISTIGLALLARLSRLSHTPATTADQLVS